MNSETKILEERNDYTISYHVPIIYPSGVWACQYTIFDGINPEQWSYAIAVNPFKHSREEVMRTLLNEWKKYKR